MAEEGGELSTQEALSKWSYGSLSIDHSSNGATDQRRLEVILKIIDDELSIEQVQTMRSRVNLGDVVNIQGFVEVINAQQGHFMLHAVDLQVETRWKDRFPDVQFVPVPSIPKSRKRSQQEMQASSAQTQEVCKHWVNTGRCQLGSNCEFVHIKGQALKEERAKWLAKRLHLKRLSAQHTEDPLDPHGKQSKNVRAQVFCDWLVETFGRESLATQNGVLDVAGGRGSVSFELWNKRRIPCRVIDPRPTKLSRQQFKFLENFPADSPHRELVDQIQELFDADRFTGSNHYKEIVTKSSVLIGMHPDEATDAIVDVALRFAKPFAIVPCCVFHQKFPARRGPNGDRVVSFEQLVEYLQAKHPAMQRAFLPFDGRNLVLFMRPTDYDAAPTSSQTQSEEL